MTTISLRPIQTGDACYLLDHHNRDGECIITVTMSDDCSSWADAKWMLCNDDSCTAPGTMDYDAEDLASVAKWCAAQWQAAQADMPPQTDRDTDGDDDARYLDCHILATWEV